MIFKLTKLINLFLVILITINNSSAQETAVAEWYELYDGKGHGNDFVNDIKVDNEYNIYLAGRSEGIDGTPDFTILKYSNTGDTLLNINFVSSENAWDEANSIAVDSKQNIYAVGSATFGNSSFYSVLFKYSSTGNLVWSKNYFYNPDIVSSGLKVVLDSQENPVIGYSLYDQYSSINFTKYSPEGDSLWTTEISDSNSTYALGDLISDTDGNIYATITRFYYDGSDIPETENTLLELNKNGNIIWKNLFKGDNPRRLRFDINGNLIVLIHGEGSVIKYDSNRDSIWFSQSNGLLTDIAIDKDNNILLCGYTGGIGGFDYLVNKISSEGYQLWGTTFNSNEGLKDFAQSVTVDKENNIYVTGSSHNSFTEGLSYTIKYNQDGELKWIYKFDVPNGIFDTPYSIFLDDSNNVIIGGDYTDSTNGNNFFILKINQMFGTGIQQVGSGLPTQYSLIQNYPNPFNPTTKIKYSIPKTSFVTLNVYDILGKKVKTLINEEKLPGSYEVTFNGIGLASGMYFYRLRSESFSQTKKLVLMK